MGTSLRGFGAYKRDLLWNIYLKFGYSEFIYSEAAEMQGFERKIFYSLYSDGWLGSKKIGNSPSIWRLSDAFRNVLLTNTFPEEQINLTKRPIREPEKKIKPHKVPIRSPEKQDSASVFKTPQLSLTNKQSTSAEDLSYKQLSERILKAIPEMLDDKEAYSAFSSDLTEIMLKHAMLWIERKKIPRQNGILIESKGFSRLQCPQCQSLNKGDSTFCVRCGNQLQDTWIEKIRKKNPGIR